MPPSCSTRKARLGYSIPRAAFRVEQEKRLSNCEAAEPLPEPDHPARTEMRWFIWAKTTKECNND
jgi:hypothetical protein